MTKIVSLTPKQLQQNYDILLQIIEENIQSERKKKLLKLYHDLSEFMIVSPASSNEDHNLAFTGGYCIHVRNVVDASLLLAKNFKQLGGSIDFTKEELVFSALNHELGRVGNKDIPYYTLCESEWHIKNEKKRFNINPKLENMSIIDRTLFLLQFAHIGISENEWIAIKNHNKANQTKSNLANIINYSVNISRNVEYDMWLNDSLSEKYELG